MSNEHDENDEVTEAAPAEAAAPTHEEPAAEAAAEPTPEEPLDPLVEFVGDGQLVVAFDGDFDACAPRLAAPVVGAADAPVPAGATAGGP